MKHGNFILIIALFALLILPLSAQDAVKNVDGPFSIKLASESAYYPIRLDVVRVDQCPFGYRVIYRKGAADFAEAYLPFEWFVPGGKGILFQANDPAYPYAIVYLKQGKFSHIKLYVKDSQKDPSWGVVRGGPELAEKFKVEEVKVQF